MCHCFDLGISSSSTGCDEYSFNKRVRFGVLLRALTNDGALRRNEEGSLGIFEAAPDDEDEEPTDLETLEPRERVGKYLSWHIRRQVSIGVFSTFGLGLPPH